MQEKNAGDKQLFMIYQYESQIGIFGTRGGFFGQTNRNRFSHSGKAEVRTPFEMVNQVVI